MGVLAAIDRALAPQPLGQLLNALLERDPRFEAQHLAGDRDVGEAVADVAEPVLAADGGPDVALAQRRAEPVRDLANAQRVTAADVDRAIDRAGRVHREHAGAR